MTRMKAATKQAEVIRAYKNVFNNPDGKLVLADMMKAHGMMSSSYKKDVNEAIFKEGERNVVLRLMSILKIDENKLKERIEAYVREQNE